MSIKDKTISDNNSKKHRLVILLDVAEKDVKDGRTTGARVFLKEFKKSVKISS
jgi:hypothetical protein